MTDSTKHDDTTEAAIQLRLNRPALDRLLGGDEEMRLLLSHAAVRQVITDHLDTVRGELLVVLNTVVQDFVGELKQPTKFLQKPKFELSVHAKEAIKSVLQPQVKEAITAHLATVQSQLDSFIANEVTLAVQSQLRERIRTTVSTLLDDINLTVARSLAASPLNVPGPRNARES